MRYARLIMESGVALEAQQPLLAPLYYIEKALKPYADVVAANNSNLVEGLDTVRPVDALAQLTDTSVAFRVQVGPDQQQTLLTAPRPLLLTLVSGILGEICTGICPDREPTAVELSLAIEAHLFLTMLPFHCDDPKRQAALYLRGLMLLQQACEWSKGRPLAYAGATTDGDTR